MFGTGSFWAGFCFFTVVLEYEDNVFVFKEAISFYFMFCVLIIHSSCVPRLKESNFLMISVKEGFSGSGMLKLSTRTL